MGAINRFADLSVSKFDPLSLDEIMAVPLYKQKQHDKLAADTEALYKSLVIDPLDVHKEEAQRIKREFEAKIDAQSLQLAKYGVDQNSNAQFLKMKREYDQLVSPTGRVGQINNAKQVRDLRFKNFMDSAEKQGIGSQRALDIWKERNENPEKYSGYDANKNITLIPEMGVAAKQDYEKDRAELHAIAGKTTSEIANKGYHFENGPNGKVLVDRTGSTVTTDNWEQLQELEKGFKSKWIDPNGEGYKYSQDAGLNITKDKVESDIRGMRENSSLDKTGQQTTFIKDPNEGSGNGEEENIDLEAVNVEGVNITKNSDLLSKLDGSFVTTTKPIDIVAARAGIKQNLVDEKARKIIKEEALNSPEYRNLAKAILRTNHNLKGKDIKSLEIQKAVQKYLQENKDVVVQNRYVDPNTNKQAMLFASKELTGKDSKEKAGNLILERVRRGAYAMVDEEGNIIDKNDVGNFDFIYSGDMTPKSQIGKNGKGLFQNPKQNIGARTGVLVDKETGESKTVYVSRSSDDFNTAQYKAMVLINSISKITDVQPGLKHPVKAALFDAYGMKDVELKYNKNKRTYDMSYTNREGKFVDVANIPDEVFQKNILEDYEKLYK